MSEVQIDKSGAEEVLAFLKVLDSVDINLEGQGLYLELEIHEGEPVLRGWNGHDYSLGYFWCDLGVWQFTPDYNVRP